MTNAVDIDEYFTVEDLVKELNFTMTRRNAYFILTTNHKDTRNIALEDLKHVRMFLIGVQYERECQRLKKKQKRKVRV